VLEDSDKLYHLVVGSARGCVVGLQELCQDDGRQHGSMRMGTRAEERNVRGTNADRGQ